MAKKTSSRASVTVKQAISRGDIVREGKMSSVAASQAVPAIKAPVVTDGDHEDEMSHEVVRAVNKMFAPKAPVEVLDEF